MSIKDFAYRSGAVVWWLLGRLIPKRNHLLVLNTFPDFDDTARAMVEATRQLGRQLVILTIEKRAKMPLWAQTAQVDARYRFSLSGMWAYHRARYVFFTHGLFSRWPLSPRQCVVNLWHGMPIKRIGLLDGKSPDQLPLFHYTIASSPFFKDIVRASFGVRSEQVLVADHPRIDVLRGGAAIATTLAGMPEHRLLAVWLPTYRASKVGDIRVDGDSRGDIFSGHYDLAELDAFFASRNVLCIIKPHPMAKANPELFERFKALIYFDEAELLRRNLTLYQLLSFSDFMITDVSSVYVDYAALGRPMIVFCPDLAEYRGSRGFSAPIESLVSDRIVSDFSGLRDRVDEIVQSGASRESNEHTRGWMPAATISLFERISASRC